ncbi:MAG: hypothetical protein ACRDTT_12275, partial [Pseudonocardiaceae bacterium]
RSNQTSEANASDTDADAPRRASNGDGNPTGADEDPKSGGSKEQNRQEENGQGVPAEPTLFDSWSGFDQPPNSNGSSRRSTGAPEPNTRRRKRDDLTDEQTSDVTRIVAAWVDAYRAAHTGVQPSVSKKGRAAREIRALISAGNDPARVLAAAESAARRGYATVETELGQLSNGNGRARVHVPYQNPSDTSAYHGTLR